MLLMNGHEAAHTPAPANTTVAVSRKSRRVGSCKSSLLDMAKHSRRGHFGHLSKAHQNAECAAQYSGALPSILNSYNILIDKWPLYERDLARPASNDRRTQLRETTVCTGST